MIKMNKAIIACLCGLFTAPGFSGERLTNEELKAFYTDKTMRGVHHKNGPGKAYYGGDGTIHNIADSGKERIGKWWIDESNNMRCVRWNGNNKDFCHITERNEDGTHSLIHRKKGKELVKFLESMPGKQL